MPEIDPSDARAADRAALRRMLAAMNLPPLEIRIAENGDPGLWPAGANVMEDMPLINSYTGGPFPPGLVELICAALNMVPGLLAALDTTKRERDQARAERDAALRRVADAERLSEDTGRERNLRNEQLTDLRTAVLGRLPMPGERHSIAVDAAISHRGDIAYEKARADAAEKRVAALETEIGEMQPADAEVQQHIERTEVRARAAEAKSAELMADWQDAEHRAADRLELLDVLRRDLAKERRWKARFKERVIELESTVSRPTVVTDAMIEAAVDAVLDLQYGDHERDCHRRHDARDGVRDGLGGYSMDCPLCRVAGSHPEVAQRARERVFRAALEAALAVGVPPAGTVRVERGVEQDNGAGGRHVRGPASPDQPQSFLDDIVRSGVGNPVPVWRTVTEGGWRTGPTPEATP